MLRHPLLSCAVAWIAGLACPSHPLSPEASALCAVTLLAGGLLLSAIPRANLAPATACVAAGFACAGCLVSFSIGRIDPGSLSGWLDQFPGLMRDGIDVEGIAQSCDRIQETPGEPARVEIVIFCRTASVHRRTIPLSGSLRLQIPMSESFVCPARGDRIRGFARIQPARDRSGEAASRWSSAAARARAPVGVVKSVRLLQVRAAARPSAPARLLQWIDALRSDLSRRLERAFAGQPDRGRAREVCRALLVGERGGIDERDLDALRAAGLSHLLAVSGFNVAVLAGLMLAVARLCGAPHRAVALACVPVLLLYLLLNRDEASVRRAVIMGVAWLAGRALGRRPDLLVTLALSALLILVPDPAGLGDAGCLLTFAATLGLIVLSPVIGGPLVALRPGWLRPVILTPVVAWLVTLPLGAVLFHRVAPGAIGANMIAGPLGAAAFVVTLALLVCSTFSAGLAVLLGCLARLLVDGLFAAARVVDLAACLSYRRPDPSLVVAGIYLAALALLCTAPAQRAGWVRRAALALLAASGLWIMAPIDSRRPPPALRISILDVGQGDAALVETPGGDRLLIDAGGHARGRFDVGERVVAPALWRRGMARLTHLALTHNDADHIGGAAAIVAAMRPAQVWLPPDWERWSPSAALARLREALRRAGSRVRLVQRGDAICLRGARIVILHPPRDWPAAASENDASLVLRAAASGRAALFMADAGRLAESALPSALLEADMLKVGHHGSRSSSGAGFLSHVRPRLAVISCGRDNRFGHPHPEVLQALRGARARICRTDRDGTIQIDLGVDGTRLGAPCARVTAP